MSDEIEKKYTEKEKEIIEEAVFQALDSLHKQKDKNMFLDEMTHNEVSQLVTKLIRKPFITRVNRNKNKLFREAVKKELEQELKELEELQKQLKHKSKQAKIEDIQNKIEEIKAYIQEKEKMFEIIKPREDNDIDMELM